MIVLSLSEVKNIIKEMEKTKGNIKVMLLYELKFENGDILRIEHDNINKYLMELE